MRGWGLTLALAILFFATHAASAQQQICRVGSVEYQCGWTPQPGPDESQEWYERGDVQVGLAVLGFAGSGGAAAFAYFRTRQRRRSLSDLLQSADRTYTQAKDSPESGIPHLVSLRMEVRHRHERGRLEDAQYLELDKRITDYIIRLRLLELDRQFSGLPAAFLQEVRRLVGDGAVSKSEAALVELHAGAHRVPEPHRTNLIRLVRGWAHEDDKNVVEIPVQTSPS